MPRFKQASAAKKRTLLTGRRRLTERVTSDSPIRAGSSRDRSSMRLSARLCFVARPASHRGERNDTFVYRDIRVGSKCLFPLD